MNGPMIAANFQPQVDARRSALLKNSVNAGAPTSITTFLNSRRTYISNQLKAADSLTFAVTSNGGADFTSTDSTVALVGTAPFAIATIEVNGVPFPATWTTATNWSIS